MDATIARLREELLRLHGPARLPVLERLWQEFAMRYWRAGPGTPLALGELSAAVETMDEAYHLIDAGHPTRRQVAGRLGWFLCLRSGAHGGGVADREAAIPLLAEALEHPGLPAALATVVRVSLGELHLDRVMAALDCAPGGFLGGAPGLRTDGEEAIRHFRVLLDDPSVSAEVATVARLMLALAEAVLPLLGDLARFDPSKLRDAIAAMQRLQANGLPSGMPGSILSSPLRFPMDPMMDPLDFPVPDMRGNPTDAPAVPSPPPAVVARAPLDSEAPRRAARTRLAALVDDPAPAVWEQARALLEAGPERLAPGDLDAFVGAAANAVDAGRDGDPVEAGLDHLLAAVGLCLRQRRDGSGWGEDDLAGGGSRAAAELLLAAATRIPPGHPAAAVVVETLGGLLEETRPLSAAISEIAGPFGEYAAGVSPGGAVVTALGQLCRTVAGLATGADIDPEPLATAVDAVPADHAWHGVLRTAVSQARLAATVRAGRAVAVDTAPGVLAPLLDALLHDDVEALRAALDTLKVTARSPRIIALLGAGYLELATRVPAREQDDVAVAIQLLRAATETLDDASENLRSRAWWRLAEAYRRRGAPTDAEASRDAGLQALRGGLDPRGASRFAGWMLADGCAVEAYTALEIAAGGSGRPDPANPLAQDVLDVLLGLAPRATRPPDPPPWTEVADAVGKAGASALLYLHPTDEAGRTAGVLCLDPGTHRLDVLANMPVTDPLTSDDPGWSAVLGRWGSGDLLVAATGNLRRIALPAVRTATGRFLAQDVDVAFVSSGAQVVDLAGRARAPVGKAPLFVVNPRGDRDQEMADVLVLRRLFYPRSACLGRALEALDAPGTREDLLARLPGASLVHLACGLRGTQLDLAGEEVLDVTTARGAGLVLLSESHGSAPPAEAFLGAGFSGVIGWQWPVPASFAGLALFLAHLMLVDHQLPPAAAVAAVQRWMLDRCRELPPLLPGFHRHTVETMDLTQPSLWAALAYHGC